MPVRTARRYAASVVGEARRGVLPHSYGQLLAVVAGRGAVSAQPVEEYSRPCLTVAGGQGVTGATGPAGEVNGARGDLAALDQGHTGGGRPARPAAGGDLAAIGGGTAGGAGTGQPAAGRTGRGGGVHGRDLSTWGGHGRGAPGQCPRPLASGRYGLVVLLVA
jgi:hypothetical protein